MLSKPTILGTYALLAVMAVAVIVSDRVGARRFEAEQQRHAAMLARPVAELKMEGLTFQEVVDELAAISGVTITIDAPQLAAVSVSPGDPMHLAVFDLPLGRALDAVVDQAGGQTKLGWRWQGDAILISTIERLMTQTAVVRVYDVRDVDMALKPPEFLPTVCFSSSSGPMAGRGPSLFFSGSSCISPDPVTEPLSSFVFDTIEPGLWRSNGGLSGAGWVSEGRLLVVAPAVIQERVGTLLGYLRPPQDP